MLNPRLILVEKPVLITAFLGIVSFAIFLSCFLRPDGSICLTILNEAHLGLICIQIKVKSKVDNHSSVSGFHYMHEILCLETHSIGVY